MKRIYAKEDICIGCRLCEVHCAVQHSGSRDLVKAFMREKPRPMPRIVVEEEGHLSFGLQCRQCDEPLCAQSCISGAMRISEDGTVLVDEEKCIGCWTCIVSCPYGAIRRRTEDRQAALKCDMCPGLEVPVCVANCPNEALALEEVEPA
jgi:carbon-monoxide dehydrogenase iron sulfur subunit